jgi:phosphatidylglycerophosphate synthase
VLTLDGLDGWLARRGGWASAFGARFDMETDALLVMVLSALVWDLDKAGAWVLLAGLARYLFVASARIWSWLARPLPPTRERQTFCVILVAALLLALAPPLQPPISAWVAAIGLAGVSYSFGIDVLWLWRRRAGA